MTYQTLRYDEPGDDGVATVTLDRPERLNAMTGAMFLELRALCEAVDGDEEVAAIVLTGAGRAFSVGLDLAEHGDLADLTVTEMMHGQETGARTIVALRAMSTPVVAAVNGVAAGGGLALALCADVRLAAPEAGFTVAFTRIGLSGCDVGVSWLLPRIVGLGHASDLMLTARLVEAGEAERIGLVNRVVPPQELLSEARALAASIAANGRFGTRLTKQVLQLNVDAPSLEAAIALENRNQVLASRTGEVSDRVRAFLAG